MPEKDTAEDYYDKCISKWSDTGRQAGINSDAFQIKPVINGFILGVHKTIGSIVTAEKAKGTKADLIITIVAGGLAFILAKVFCSVVRDLQPGMDKESFWKTFEGMYASAIRNIEKGSE
jgi:hypothetical protein